MSALGSDLYQQSEPFWGPSHGAGHPSIVHPSIVHRKNGDNHGGTVGQRPPLFTGILPGDYTRIAAAARIKEFTRGEMLYIEATLYSRSYYSPRASRKSTSLD